MTNIVPCMGGFCSKRDGCVHYHSTADMNPSERLCGQGKDEPETAKALGFTPMAIEKRVVRIDTNARGKARPEAKP